MKNITFVLLLAVLTFGIAFAPTHAFAKGGSDNSGSSHSGGDDDSHEDNDDDDDDDDDIDDDNSNSNNDNSTSNSLEAEADVFTDTTIVKVELRNGRTTVFETDSDTRDEVLDDIVGRFDLSRSEVNAVLDFEVEDRASRAKDRASVNNDNDDDDDNNNDSGSDDDSDDLCSSNSSSLEVEADVFTDTTIVKVERNGTVTVFETGATTSEGVVDVVANRFNISQSDVRGVIDFQVEDRASRNSDFTANSNSSNCDDSNNSNSNNSNNSSQNNRDIQEKIAKLQELIRVLIQLFNAQFGGSL